MKQNTLLTADKKKTTFKGFARRSINCQNDNFFGIALRKIRIANNITQIEAASFLNITQSQWSAYEVGKTMPNLQTIILIAEAVKIEPLELINEALNEIGLFQNTAIEEDILEKEGMMMI